MGQNAPQPAPSKMSTSTLLYGFLLVCVALGIIKNVVTNLSESGGSHEAAAPPRPPDYSAEAFVISHQAMERRLKAPSTAKFAGLNDEGTEVQDLGDGMFAVKSFVDAENSFGAKIRMRYLMTLQRKSDGNWTVDSLVTDP